MAPHLRTALVRALRPGALLAALAVFAPELHAQRLGFEAGVSSVQNQSAAPALGLSLLLPLTERFRGSASYTRWTGCDNGDCADPRVGNGNQGVNLLGLYRILGSRSTNASLGAGFGWYEKYRLEGAGSDRYWEDAMTFAGELRRAVSYNSSLYLRGELSVPTDDDRPHWSSVRLGVDVGMF